MNSSLVERFAVEWIAAWNAHDIQRVLTLYADDFEMSSPLIIQVAGESSGRLRGKAAVAAYWNKALQIHPGLELELLEVFTGVASVVLYYRGARGRLAAEVFLFDENQLVSRAFAHHGS